MNSNDKKALTVAALAFSTAVAGIIGLRCYDNVSNNNFAVRVVKGQPEKQFYCPGYYGKSPLFDSFYEFSNNTVRLETSAGSGRNTKDNNSFSMGLRVHYKIKPDVGIINFHLDELSSSNGQALLKHLMDSTVDAIVGQVRAEDAVNMPSDILKDFVPQLEQRLKLNNVAIEIEMIELLNVQMGNGFTKNVQLKAIPGQDVQPMSGPSAIPVNPVPSKRACP